jgi:hypothetical protein
MRIPKMKINTLRIFFLLLLLFTECKKWVIDHRNKYIGDYTFELTTHSYDFTSNVWKTETVQADGKIYYRPLHSFKKYIIIEFNSGLSFSPDIDKNGTLEETCSKTLSGKISSTEIQFTASSGGNCNEGGHAPGISYTVTGTRK